MIEKTTVDYESKVSKLINNLSNNTDVIIENNKNLNLKYEKIIFVDEKNNKDILINLSSDEKYSIDIPKSKIDLELGTKILDFVQNQRTETESALKLNKNPVKKKLTNLVSNQIFSTKIIPLNKISTSTDNELNYLISNEKSKIPVIKLSYREYFNSIPKCDLCNLTGITIEELKKYAKEVQTDCIVYEYPLFQCVFCKVYLHKNCCNNEILSCSNMKNSINWVCDRCKAISQHDESPICQICFKKDNQFKKPHHYKMIENNFWVHSVCFTWFKSVFNIDEINIQMKIKQYLLMNHTNTPCYKCSGSDKKLFTMKCSFQECNKYFHPICAKEGLHFINLTYTTNYLYAVCYCEDHSQKFLIENLNFNKF